VARIYQTLAVVRETPVDEVIRQVAANFEALFPDTASRFPLPASRS
jgi:Tat protein secretion system quality control protein TatD with DNase activity